MSQFEFLARCGRPECEPVRVLLNEWYGAYPSDHRERLYQELTSDDHNSHAAFWELYVFTLLRALGYQVEVHPEIAKTSKRPDFLARVPGGAEFIMEAVIIGPKGAKGTAIENRKKSALEVVDRIQHPRFQVWLSEKGEPEETPSGKAIAEHLSSWLETLDYEACQALVDRGAFDSLPSTKIEIERWSLSFRAFPRPRHRLGEVNRQMICMHDGPFSWIDSRTPVRDRVKKKATRYGRLGIPYVFAVNVQDPFFDEIDIGEFLFGKEEIQFASDSFEPGDHRFVRRPDGVWTDRSGIQNTRLTAVLLGRSVNPHSVATASLDLCVNPWSEHVEVPGHLTSLSRFTPNDGKYERAEGLSPRDVFSLPDGWPFEHA
jgi:hypothetical protein